MKQLLASFIFFLSFHAWGQDIDDMDSELSMFAPLIYTLNNFSNNIPQEKVYLHFDNTSYFQGDPIWFNCYIVTTDRHQLSQLSRTLYVELFNPGGEIIDKKVLKIEDGQCHGDFALDHLPFYSGFYEVRAYTKYMLNFGDDVIFSRLLPVFDKPKTEGAYEEKKMLRYGRYGPLGSYPMKREAPIREKAVNLHFFPEGGNMVQGITSRVAFEATDAVGNPIDVSGVVRDANRQVVCPIITLHEGRGVFIYTPKDVAGRQKDIAEVEYAGKKYQFELPDGLPCGVVMTVDNLSQPDSIEVTLRKTVDIPAEMLGIAVLSGGKIRNCTFVRIEDNEINFAINKKMLPAGVSQIVLFNNKGDIICDRLIFSGKIDFLNIKPTTNKPVYRPYEQVDMDITVTDMKTNPVSTTFSVSVRDGANEVEYKHNILTDLLLMSEIKGYVRNPSWYFEAGDGLVETSQATSLLNHRTTSLDVLLMVQGWRRYAWKQMTGAEPFEVKYLPEQGIETQGRIVSSVRQKPQPGVDVLLVLQKRKVGDEQGGSYVENFMTDEQGRFSFVSDVSGRWNMVLSVTEKGKKKDHRILLDRLFTPEPKRYSYTDLQIINAENNMENMNGDEVNDDFKEETDTLLTAFQNSVAGLVIDKKIIRLPEVSVKAKRSTDAQDIYRNRSTSIVYYDMASEMDNIYDNGKFAGNDIHKMLVLSNKNFTIARIGGNEYLRYKGKPFFTSKGNKIYPWIPLFVINYKKAYSWNEVEYFKYKNISLNAIKSIYINENPSVKCKYANTELQTVYDYTCSDLDDFFSCVVFIETYPEGKIPVEGAKGVRKTWLEGYSPVKEFYHPDYSALPPDPDDYRCTLYWNPAVTTDENGKAKINFYNNNRSTSLIINAETVTPHGLIGVINMER